MTGDAVTKAARETFWGAKASMELPMASRPTKASEAYFFEHRKDMVREIIEARPQVWMVLFYFIYFWSKIPVHRTQQQHHTKTSLVITSSSSSCEKTSG